MKRRVSIMFMILILSILYFFSKSVNAKNIDKQRIRNYVNTHYGKNWKIKYVSWTNPIVLNRTEYTNKKIIIVDMIKSKSTGKRDLRNHRYYGKIPKTKYLCWYSKKVKKGKIVTQYTIHNPYSNECDDFVAIVDNGIIR